MRPATAPTGSRMTASVSESQTSSPPRMIETSRSPCGASALGLEARAGAPATGVRPSASSAGTPVICSAAAFHSTTSPSRSTATMPSAMFARIATLRSFSSATRWYSSAFESAADVFAASASSASISSVAPRRAARARRRRARRAALPSGPDERHAEVRGVCRREHRVGSAQPRDRRRRPRARPASATGRRRRRARPLAATRVPSASSAPAPLGGADDELVVLEHPDRAGVGVPSIAAPAARPRRGRRPGRARSRAGRPYARAAARARARCARPRRARSARARRAPHRAR